MGLRATGSPRSTGPVLTVARPWHTLTRAQIHRRNPKPPQGSKTAASGETTARDCDSPCAAPARSSAQQAGPRERDNDRPAPLRIASRTRHRSMRPRKKGTPPTASKATAPSRELREHNGSASQPAHRRHSARTTRPSWRNRLTLAAQRPKHSLRSGDPTLGGRSHRRTTLRGDGVSGGDDTAARPPPQSGYRTAHRAATDPRRR